AASSLRTSRLPAGRGRPRACGTASTRWRSPPSPWRGPAPPVTPVTTTRAASQVRVRRDTAQTRASWPSSQSLVRLLRSGIADPDLSVQQLLHEFDALVFQGRVNTFGSSMVASYIRWYGLTGVYRSTTCSASLWKLPARSNQVWSLKLVTSTTSVSPSQCPRDHPIHVSLGLEPASSMWIVRVAPANS